MMVYRLCRQEHMQLDGKGAELYGGRWNNKGNAMIYTSASVSLCVLELLVHVPSTLIPKNHMLMSIAIPDDEIIGEVKGLKENWNTLPYSESSQRIGDEWLKKGKELVLKVPSAIVLNEYNFLVNPRHPRIGEIKIKESRTFEFDSRLFAQNII